MAKPTKRTRKRDKVEVYDAEVRVKGHEPQYKTFTNYKEAKEWIKATEVALRAGKCLNIGEARKNTISDAIDRYLNIYLRQYPHRIPKQTQLLSWWKVKVGHLRLSQITAAIIAECRDTLAVESTYRKSVRSGSTVNRYLAAFSKVLTLCVREWCWLETSPMMRVGKLKEGSGKTRYLSIEEIHKLLEASKRSRNKALYPVVAIALTTGMRYSEIISLEWSQVDLNNGFIHLYTTKNGTQRTVPVSSEITSLLKELKAKSKENLVFPPVRRIGNSKGLIQLRSAFETALRDAGIAGATFHTLRHTAASHFSMQGANTSALMSLLGHKTPSMSKRYSHFSDTYLKEVVQFSSDTLLNGVSHNEKC